MAVPVCDPRKMSRRRRRRNQGNKLEKSKE